MKRFALRVATKDDRRWKITNANGDEHFVHIGVTSQVEMGYTVYSFILGPLCLGVLIKQRRR